MPQAVAQSRVIWRHPRGRFDVVETCGTSPLGPPYVIREAVFTPERDARGQIQEKISHRAFHCGTNKAIKPAKAHREYRPIREKEGVMIMDMYGAGWTITKIAQVLHRDRTKISEYITEQQ